MEKDYQMTTVLKYVELLDSETSQKEKSIKASIEKYLYRTRKARTQANIIEDLLA